MKRLSSLILGLLAGMLRAGNAPVAFVEVDGAIGPATSGYLLRATKKAGEIKWF
jgi:membrane-bound ClpP family serine protease